jgi:hypothetical protein
MKHTEHWSRAETISVAENAGGCGNRRSARQLVRAGLWPSPELIQKLHASDRWRGKTEQDDLAARGLPWALLRLAIIEQ